MSSPQTPSPIARRQEDTTSTPPPRNPFSTSIQDPVITMSGVRASSSRIRPRGSFSFRSSPTVALSVSGGENWRMSEREVAQAAAMEDSDDEPLDGEEGIVVQDEACYVEDWNGKVGKYKQST